MRHAQLDPNFITARRLFMGITGLLKWVLPGAVLLVVLVYASLTLRGIVPETSIWHFAAQGPRWLLFTIFLVFTVMDLPVHIANGATRRAYFIGSHLAAVLAATLFAVIVALGFVIEAVIASGWGWPLRLPESNLSVSSYHAGRMLLELPASLAIYCAVGVLVGGAYYRFGGLKGTFLLPLTLLPIILLEGLKDQPALIGLAQLSGLWLALVGLALFVLSALLSWFMLRDIAVRTRSS